MRRLIVAAAMACTDCRRRWLAPRRRSLQLASVSGQARCTTRTLDRTAGGLCISHYKGRQMRWTVQGYDALCNWERTRHWWRKQHEELVKRGAS